MLISLDQLCIVSTNMEDADFWLQRRGSMKTVGSVIRDDFNPENIGLKMRRDIFVSAKYLSYLLEAFHLNGGFRELANGTTDLVSIKVSSVKYLAF